MPDKTVADMLEENRFEFFRVIAGERYIAVQRRIYNAILLTGSISDLMGYDQHWCYEDLTQAILAAAVWNPSDTPEPEGWFRHAASGRRRPGGDKTKEYISH